MKYRFDIDSPMGRVVVRVEAGWEELAPLNIDNISGTKRREFMEWLSHQRGPFGHTVLNVVHQARPSDLNFMVNYLKIGNMVEGKLETMKDGGDAI